MSYVPDYTIEKDMVYTPWNMDLTQLDAFMKALERHRVLLTVKQQITSLSVLDMRDWALEDTTTISRHLKNALSVATG